MPDDLEPGWGVLTILLWPVQAFFKAKAWIHDLIHPEDSEES